jgi:hypothetical protein
LFQNHERRRRRRRRRIRRRRRGGGGAHCIVKVAYSFLAIKERRYKLLYC